MKENNYNKNKQTKKQRILRSCEVWNGEFTCWSKHIPMKVQQHAAEAQAKPD